MQPKHSTLGQIIGEYEIIDFLGRGGMGEVYLAKHPKIGKKIAIKHLKPEFARDQEVLRRFMQEAEAVNQIQHENLIDIFNFVQTKDGLCYILMEYLEGQPLSALIRGEDHPALSRLGHISLQLCSALLAAHDKGIIHRDLKPDNIMLTTRSGQKDFVKILDFGLAKLQERSGAEPLSIPGIPIGTPAYMSPEQAAGEVVDARADVYSLGVILYEMTTKTLPFFSVDLGALLRKQMIAAVPSPRSRNALLDARLEAVILRCLEKEPEARYASMYELAVALSQACNVSMAPYFGAALLSARGVPSVQEAPLHDSVREQTKRNKPPLPEEQAATSSLSSEITHNKKASEETVTKILPARKLPPEEGAPTKQVESLSGVVVPALSPPMAPHATMVTRVLSVLALALLGFMFRFWPSEVQTQSAALTQPTPRKESPITLPSASTPVVQASSPPASQPKAPTKPPKKVIPAVKPPIEAKKVAPEDPKKPPTLQRDANGIIVLP